MCYNTWKQLGSLNVQQFITDNKLDIDFDNPLVHHQIIDVQNSSILCAKDIQVNHHKEWHGLGREQV